MGSVGSWNENPLGDLAGPAVLKRYDQCQNNAQESFETAIGYISQAQLLANSDTYEVEIQDMPDVTEPDMEAKDITAPTAPDTAMADVTAPDSITITDVTLENTRPVPEITSPEDLTAPTNTFSFSEATYTSSLLDATKEKLETDVEVGGTGLGAAIEADIWTRQEERDLQALQDEKDRIVAQWAESGFILPDGVLAGLLQEAEKQYSDARLTASRDIAIKQAELAQANTHKVIEQSVILESKKIDYASQQAERQLQAEKYAIDAAIAIFEAGVKKYSAQLDALKTIMEAAKIEADIAVAKAQAQTEIQKARAAIYASEVQAFSARIEAEKTRVTALVQAYQGLVDAYKAETQADASRIESATKVFTARIQRATTLGEQYIKQAELELTEHTEKMKLQASLVDSASKVAAQLAAAAMAATNANLSYGQSDGKQESYSTSNAASFSESESTQFSNSVSNNTNTSNSTSNNTNYNYNYSE